MSKDDLIEGTAMARALDDFPVPGLNAGFADRVLIAAQGRAMPLPPLRRANGGGGAAGRRWRLSQRFVIATLGFGALATAAAATGVLERFDLPVPSPARVWASMTGNAAPAQTAAAPVTAPVIAQGVASSDAVPVVIDGLIDTPEELGEAFRRIDAVREGREAARRQAIDARIERAIERRRAAGLPLPTPEQQARLRERIGAGQAQRQRLANERVNARRAELQSKVENGEALTRENVLRPLREDAAAPALEAQLARLRQMTPQQRRVALRQLPPAQRRILIGQLRARRGAAALPAPELAPLQSDNQPATIATEENSVSPEDAPATTVEQLPPGSAF